MKQSPASRSSRTADKFVVRLPEGMRSRIAEVARHYHRSMNSEIIARLEKTLLAEGNLPDAAANAPVHGELHPHEHQLLRHFRQLPQPQQSALIALLGSSTGTQQN
ncbi:Arc family DNA-binding protein [Pseudomonas sp. MAP12]|uniref:Arc family DNA-binding protein n=1 Tax=Geopseudomonas aromaticivorans TaxID=2849492 RepID=A0ABS6MRQ1_9GAMM|nr:Arc family DNA-binding protein [Pseudomonas aromaticivorans]MBV2131461.1 Arc family DNA-binding protein [Pseudomonas aromaticivorans]